MADALRVVLLIALAAAVLTTLALALSWWMEPQRRLRRAMLKALGAPPEVEALSPGEGRACALNFDVEQVVVLWANGAHGLAYAFEEVEGGEIIVDGHVVARIRRARRASRWTSWPPTPNRSCCASCSPTLAIPSSKWPCGTPPCPPRPALPARPCAWAVAGCRIWRPC